jgi:hypothetical protein
VPVVPGILGGAAHLVGDLFTGNVGDMAVQGLKAILAFLFGGLQKDVSVRLLQWLTTVSPQISGPSVRGLYQVTAGMAIGLLGLVMTVTVARLYVGGLSLAGGGGFNALEGLSRSVAAGLFLLLWPWMFSALVGLCNHASATVLASGADQHAVVKILTVTLVLGALTGAGAILVLFQVIVGALLFMALLLLKVVVGAATTLLFVAGPLAIVMWPLEELAWLSRFVMRALITLLLIPLVWALIFATFAAVSADALGSASSPLPHLTGGLVGIAMLWLAVSIPRDLLRLAMLGVRGGRGGIVARTAGYVASRQAYAALTGAEVLPFLPRGQGAGGVPGADARGGDERDAHATPPQAAAAPAAAVSEPEHPAAWRWAGWDGGSEEPEASTSPRAGGGGPPDPAEHPGPAPAGGDEGHAATAQPPTVSGEPRASANDGLGQTSPPPMDSIPGGPSALALGDALALAARRAEEAGQRPAGQQALHAEAQRALERMDAPARERLAHTWAQEGSEGIVAQTAAWATSPQVTAAQAEDLLTLAAAGRGGVLDPLFGTPEPAPPDEGESVEETRKQLWDRARESGMADAIAPTSPPGASLSVEPGDPRPPAGQPPLPPQSGS